MTTTTTPTPRLDQKQIVRYQNGALHDLAVRMTGQPPELATLRQFLIYGTGGGHYALREVETRISPIISKPLRPSRFWPQINMLSPEAILASFFEGPGGECFDKGRDEEIWKAACAAATTARIAGNDARTLSRACAAALAIRCGMAPPTVSEVL